MADIDWPTSEPFRPVLPYSFGVSTPKSGTRGFYSGENETAGHLADRFLTSITLPPCSGAAAAQRSAFLMGALSRGDRFRFRVPHHAGNSGTLDGPVVVSANALAGARSVSVSGGLAGANLLRNSGFEIDTNADGIADGWGGYSSGSTGTVTRYTFAGPLLVAEAGVRFQAVQATALNGAVGYSSQPVAVMAGAVYTASAGMQASAGDNCVITIVWLDGGGAYMSESSGAHSVGIGRRSVTGTAPGGAATAQVTVYVAATGGVALAFNVDNVQLQPGLGATYAGPPALLAGDFIGIGGNLLQVAYGGAILNDAGAGAVPLTLPLARPITAGAAVTLQQPVGLWQIDTTDGISFDFAAPVVQMGVTIPFRQVIV